MIAGTGQCPRCGRTIGTDSGRYVRHLDGSDAICTLTDQHRPYTGTSAADYVGRARLVADLAQQVQDEDPARVWDYLTSLPAGELQRMMMVALAAIRTDQTLDEMFAWVVALPVARKAA